MANEENLTPFKPGQSGNPNGRPKGSKNLASIIRELENEDFDWSKVPIKNKDQAKLIGSPWKAIVLTALAKAFSGDIQAAEWLRKGGYGDKIIFEGGLFNAAKIEVKVVNGSPIEPEAGIDAEALESSTDS